MSVTIKGTDTSAAAPSFTGSDSDTGLYFPAAGQAAIATNGTQALIVDSSQNVGIGTSSPTTQKLHISAASVSGPTNNPAGIRITDTGTSEDIQLVNRSGNMLYNVATGNNYSWQIDSNEVASIDSSGRLLTPSQPSFHAFPTSSFTTASGGSAASPFTGSNFSSTEFNVGSCFNASNARFTAPVTGIYFFNLALYAATDPGVVLEAKFFVNGQEYRRFYVRAGDNINNESAGVTALIDLAAGDYVQPGWYSTASFDVGGSQSANSVHYTYYEGYLVG